ncbi:MAG: capsule assembly Wzi family protein [Steroidobacteraceae bacterium]|nr:capsule assembly Wzi family protein [Steroidobacteraceae bacterium]
MRLSLVRGGLATLGWLAVALLVGGVATAEPWLAPGDVGLRSDLQLLADEGIVATPLTSWPLSWADISRDLERIRGDVLRTPSLEEAYVRVRREAFRNTRVNEVEFAVGASAAESPVHVRGFEDTPREEAEIAGTIDWTGARFAARIEVARVQKPADDRRTRLDGSYVGVVAGNVLISAGYVEKWWGPGWAGSLILSSNARPVPSLTIERNYSDPFEFAALRWLGPWRASFQAGRLEGSRDDHPRAHFMALRLTARPLPRLEIGVSRTAQLCGEGRACTLGSYWDMIVGNDNDQALGEQPGNQLAGFDFRWSPSRRVPVAVYGQAIGEDEAGFLPSKYLGLAGLESWGQAGRWNWRGYAEYARTSCDFSRREPLPGCAYESSIFTDGYRYRGRAIGHAWDRDGEGWTVGAVATRGAWSAHLRAHRVDLNALDAGETHSVAPRRGTLRGIETAASLDLHSARIRAGIGYDETSGSRVAVDSGAKAFLELRAYL